MGADQCVVVDAGILQNASGANGAARANVRGTEKLHAGLDDRIGTGSHIGIDQHGFRKINGCAGIHDCGCFSGAENAIDISEMHPRVAAENFAGVGGDLRQHALIAFAEQARSRRSDRVRDGRFPGAER